MSICLQRREFIAGLGGAAAWPLAARAQQRAMPVIGYLGGRAAESDASLLVSLRRGLADVGYAEGRNVAIEYRFADGRYDRLSGQLIDLTEPMNSGTVVVGTDGFTSITKGERMRLATGAISRMKLKLSLS